MSSSVKSRLRATADFARAQGVFGVALVSVLLLGFYLRAVGVLWGPQMDFWLDEAAWAVYLFRLPFRELAVRPIGFIAVSRALAAIFGPSENVLRALPWVASVAMLPVLPLLARRLFSARAAQLLFVGVIALHPGVVNLAKEFKPYSVGLSLHLLLLWLTLRYFASERQRDLLILLAFAILSQLFSQDILFAYPGVFAAIGLDAIIKRRFRALAWIVSGALVASGLLIAQYVFLWSQVVDSSLQSWWTKSFHAFPSAGESRLSWALDQFKDLLAFADPRPSLASVSRASRRALRVWVELDALLWLLVASVGLGELVVQRRWRAALLLLTPPMVCLAAAFAGAWPFGAVRTNLFLLAYVAAVAGMAFDTRAAPSHWTLALVPTLVLLVVPLFVFEQDWGEKKRYLAYQSDLPNALHALARQSRSFHGRTEKLLVADSVVLMFQYYTEYHPELSAGLGALVRQRFELQEGTPSADSGRFWLIADRPSSWRRLRSRFQVSPINRGKVQVFRVRPKPE